MSDAQRASELPVLRLRRNEDRRLHAGHAWVFSNEVDTAQTPLTRFTPGALVRVLAHNDRALGLAYVNPSSLICARLLNTWHMPDAAWFAERLRRALRMREALYPQPFYRWVFGEADFLPGLVIDRFDSVCVVQTATAGMDRLKDVIVEAVIEVAAPSAILLKNDSSARELEHLAKETQWVHGAAVDEVEIVESGVRFKASLSEGQKTGWFYDQSANRDALARFVKPGARVLDVFSYVGAWGIRAAKAAEAVAAKAPAAAAAATAASVTCVDASATALAAAARNGEANGVALQTRKGDAFEVLEALKGEGAKFDVVIVDPPAFAKRKKDLPQAIAAYKRINQAAMSLLDDGGLLVSCSCSYHMSADDLQNAIGKAARGAERTLQILAQGGQAPDHPVHPAIAETRYLKAFYCRVGNALN